MVDICKKSAMSRQGKNDRNHAERRFLFDHPLKILRHFPDGDDSDLEQNVSSLQQYLNESDEDEDDDPGAMSHPPPVLTAMDPSSSLRLPIGSGRNCRSDRPKLPPDFLNIPPPSHPPPPSRPPDPPRRQPPSVPPSVYTPDDSQYDEAQPPVRSLLQPGLLENYQVSTSKMNRVSSTLFRDDYDETCHSILRENPEIGSFYVPSGSGHTTMSSLSPQSRFDNDRLATYSLLPGSGTTVPVNVLPLRPEFTGASQTNYSNDMVKTPKKLQSNKPVQYDCSWRSIALTLAFLLMLAIIVIFYLFVCLLSTADSSDHYSSLSTNQLSIFPPKTILRPMPESFELGDRVVVDLPPNTLINSYFAVQKDSSVSFNVTVDIDTNLIIYGRRTIRPSHSINDFVEVVNGNKLHLVEKRSIYGANDKNLRRAFFVHYLLAGRWHLGFFNDNQTPKTVRFSIALLDDRLDDCKYDCNGKGDCRDGKCFCHDNYQGIYCDKIECPEVCSGNGIFSNGRCYCHQGWKGVDCRLPSHLCSIPNCNGNGHCDNGHCVCNLGFVNLFIFSGKIIPIFRLLAFPIAISDGDSCDRPSCPGVNCSGHGICLDSRCFCEPDWIDKDCSRRHTPEDRVDLSGSHPDSACSQHGIYEPASLSCVCDKDWEGDICDKEICPRPCDVHGYCHSGHCICSHGWTGDQCSLLVCLPGCKEHGLCDNGTCTCQDGWNGFACQLSGCPNECTGAGNCQKLDTEWRCVCDIDHYGHDCSVPKERICDDEEDNDGDGLTDCEDSECCMSKACLDSLLCQTVPNPSTVLIRGTTPSSSASFFQKVKFLIRAGSVQQYADERLFDQRRVSVIRGRVVSEKGAPLIGVRVSESAHPPLFGFTITRGGNAGGGAFDLLVNGGRSVTLQFMRKPYSKVVRRFSVPWSDIVYVGNVVMRLDENEASRETFSTVCQRTTLLHRIRPTLIPSWQLTRSTGILDGSAKLMSDSRTILDSVPISGTDGLYLTYSSCRAPGFRSTLIMRLVPDVMPDQLRLVRLHVDVAGVHFETVLEARPNLTYTYDWDRRNVYAQAVHGLSRAKVSVGYIYANCSQPIWQFQLVTMDGHKSSDSDLGGWNLNIHHHYDTINNVLEKGDGSVEYLDESAAILETILGAGNHPRPMDCRKCNSPAESARLLRPMALTVGADGSLYVGDSNLVRRMTPDGQLVTVLELSPVDTAHSYHLAIDPTSDHLYISLPLRRQVWRIVATQQVPFDVSTNYQVIVGTGETCTGEEAFLCGDGGPSKSAHLVFPKGLTFDSEGTMYLVDGRTIRTISPDLLISTLVPARIWASSRPCSAYLLLADLNLEWPTDVTIDRLSGELLLLDADVVYGLNPVTKTVRIALGTPVYCPLLITASNQSFVPIRLYSARSLAVDNRGSILVAESDGKRIARIRKFPHDQQPLLLVGKPSKCDCHRKNCPCDNDRPILATEGNLHSPTAVAVDHLGTVHIADESNFKVKSVKSGRPRWDSAIRMYRIPRPDSNEIYLFNGFGQHVATRSLLTDLFVYNFTYHIDNSYGRLTHVTGGGGHRLYLVRRDSEVKLETSHGRTTTAFFGKFDDMLQKVELPGRPSILLDYDADKGLLLSKSTVSGIWFYEYTDDGRAKRLVTPVGNVYSVETTVEGKKLVTNVRRNGRFYARFDYSPLELTANAANQRRILFLADGFSLDEPNQHSLFSTAEQPLLNENKMTILKRKVVLTNGQNQLSSRLEWRQYTRRMGRGRKKKVVQVGRKPRVNGRNVLTIEYDRESRTDTIRSRNDLDILKVHYNDAGQPLLFESVSSHLASMNLTYNSIGDVKLIQWGGRQADFVYDGQNRLTDVTSGPEGNLLPRRYSFGMKALVWPSKVQVPSGSEYSLDYDIEGSLQQIITPSGDVHSFHRALDISRTLLLRFIPFSSLPFVMSVDLHGRPLEFISPNTGKSARWIRCPYGKLRKLIADGQITYFKRDHQSYIAESGHYRREITKRGPLVMSIDDRRGGTNGGHFIYNYDSLLRLSAIHANFDGITTLEPLNFVYDQSGRLTRFRSYDFHYDGPKTRIMGEYVVLERMYGPQRQLISQTLAIRSSKVLEQTVHTDAIGRIQGMEMNINGEQRPVHVRTYNVDGTLAQLNIGEGSRFRWTLHYDLDGRLKAIDDVRLEVEHGLSLKLDSTKYDVDSDGSVRGRGDQGFDYDSFGHLIHVHLRQHDDIFYRYDHQHRLIGRRNGLVWTHFYYAFPSFPQLLTHITTDTRTYIFSYDDRQNLLAVELSGEHFVVITDPEGTPTHIFGEDGSLIKEMVRDPLGRIVSDSNLDFEMFVGWNGCLQLRKPFLQLYLQDHLSGVIFLDGRPIDSFTGRFMSISPMSILRLVDPNYPEMVDLFRVRFDSTRKEQLLPLDIMSWLKLTGLSLDQLAPLLSLDDSQWDSASRLCSRQLVTLSSVECSLSVRLHHFGNFLTFRPSPLLPPVHPSLPIWSSISSIVDNGISISTNDEMRVVVRFADSVELATYEALTVLLNRSSLINMPHMSSSPPWSTRHFWKKTDDNSMQDLTSLGIVSKTSILTDRLNITVDDNSVIVQSPACSAVIHYGKHVYLIQKELIRKHREKNADIFWALERTNVKKGRYGYRKWSNEQSEQLLETGRVDGIQAVFRAPSSVTSTSIADLGFWTFE